MWKEVCVSLVSISGAFIALQFSTQIIKYPRNDKPCAEKNKNAWGAHLSLPKSLPILIGVGGFGAAVTSFLFSLGYMPVQVGLILAAMPETLIALFTLRDILLYVVKRQRAFAYGMPFFNSFMESLLEAATDGNIQWISIFLGCAGFSVAMVFKLLVYLWGWYFSKGI